MLILEIFSVSKRLISIMQIFISFLDLYENLDDPKLLQSE